jgi:hypothetical protein
VAPFPEPWLERDTEPPMDAMIFLVIARPRPVPPWRRA